MNKKELIDKQALIDELMKIPGVGSNSDALETIKRFPSYGPQKAKAPACVAKWISKCQELNWNLSDLLAPEFFDSPFALNTKEWLRQDKQNYDILARAWLDGYEVEESKWVVNEGDLVIRKGEHEAKVYFVESVDDDGILLVNGIKDEFFTDLDDRSVDEESINYFYENFRLLAKKENLEAEKVEV
ncbi:TPA: DUF1642 domain-containing protein [Enterococcus faecium]